MKIRFQDIHHQEIRSLLFLIDNVFDAPGMDSLIREAYQNFANSVYAYMGDFEEPPPYDLKYYLAVVPDNDLETFECELPEQLYSHLSWSVLEVLHNPASDVVG